MSEGRNGKEERKSQRRNNKKGKIRKERIKDELQWSRINDVDHQNKRIQIAIGTVHNKNMTTMKGKIKDKIKINDDDVTVGGGFSSRTGEKGGRIGNTEAM